MVLQSLYMHVFLFVYSDSVPMFIHSNDRSLTGLMNVEMTCPRRELWLWSEFVAYINSIHESCVWVVEWMSEWFNKKKQRSSTFYCCHFTTNLRNCRVTATYIHIGSYNFCFFAHDYHKNLAIYSNLSLSIIKLRTTWQTCHFSVLKNAI